MKSNFGPNMVKFHYQTNLKRYLKKLFLLILRQDQVQKKQLMILGCNQKLHLKKKLDKKCLKDKKIFSYIKNRKRNKRKSKKLTIQTTSQKEMEKMMASKLIKLNQKKNCMHSKKPIKTLKSFLKLIQTLSNLPSSKLLRPLISHHQLTKISTNLHLPLVILTMKPTTLSSNSKRQIKTIQTSNS